MVIFSAVSRVKRAPYSQFVSDYSETTREIMVLTQFQIHYEIIKVVNPNHGTDVKH